MAKLGQYNLDEMTAQEVYVVGCEHLLEQSKQSKLYPKGCVYNGDGVCCPAGIFIQDYNEGMEDQGWYTLAEVHDQSKCHTRLVSYLQCVHDNDLEVNHWWSKLYELPEKLGMYCLNPFLIKWSFNYTTDQYIKHTD